MAQMILPSRQPLLAISDLTNLMQVLPWVAKSGSADTLIGRQSSMLSRFSEGAPSLQQTSGTVSPFSSKPKIRKFQVSINHLFNVLMSQHSSSGTKSPRQSLRHKLYCSNKF